MGTEDEVRVTTGGASSPVYGTPTSAMFGMLVDQHVMHKLGGLVDPVTQRFHYRPKPLRDGSLDHWNSFPGFMYKKLYNSAAGVAMAHCSTTVQNMDGRGLEVQAVGKMQEVPLPEPVFDMQGTQSRRCMAHNQWWIWRK